MTDTSNRYRGVLNRKIRTDSKTTEIELLYAEAERFVALFRHFGVEPSDPDAEFQLVLALARKHVPGFQRAAPQYSNNQSGRPNNLSPVERMLLQGYVRRTREQVDPETGRAFTISNALKKIAGRSEFKHLKEGTIRRTYFRDRKASNFLHALCEEIVKKIETTEARRRRPKIRLGAFDARVLADTSPLKKRVRKSK